MLIGSPITFVGKHASCTWCSTGTASSRNLRRSWSAQPHTCSQPQPSKSRAVRLAPTLLRASDFCGSRNVRADWPGLAMIGRSPGRLVSGSPLTTLNCRRPSPPPVLSRSSCGGIPPNVCVVLAPERLAHELPPLTSERAWSRITFSRVLIREDELQSIRFGLCEPTWRILS
jgi:hypothetical protein